MKKKNTSRKSRTDWERLQSMHDEDINKEDIPPLEAVFFKNAKLRMPSAKPTITIRIDRDILNWLKKQGKGYQTRINAILRLYFEARRHTARSR